MYCLISTCGSRFDMHQHKHGYSSHRLPKDLNVRLAWLKILDPSGTQYTIGSETRICSVHFRPEDFYVAGGKRRLYKTAVPSLHLGPAAELPPADLPEEPHCVYLDESSMLSTEEPMTLHSTAIAAQQHASQWSQPTGQKTVKPLRYTEDFKTELNDDDGMPSISPEEAQRPQPAVQKKVKPLRYAGDLKTALNEDDEMPSISPEEAQRVLPKVYKQLQRTQMRLQCYRQQNLRLRKKVEHLKDIIADLRNEYDVANAAPKRKARSQEVNIEEAR